jgi:hypothetical protein
MRYGRLAILFLCLAGGIWAQSITQPVLATIAIPNAGSTGTTLNTLTKLTGAPSTAVIAATTDTLGVVGVTIAGAGTTGTAIIQINGLVNCVFSGATTAGHYVQISSTTGGDCVDSGAATYPVAGGEVIGRVLSTNTGAGTYQINLFSADIQPPENVSGCPTGGAGVVQASNGSGKCEATSITDNGTTVSTPEPIVSSPTGNGVVNVTLNATTGSAASMLVLNGLFGNQTVLDPFGDMTASGNINGSFFYVNDNNKFSATGCGTPTSLVGGDTVGRFVAEAVSCTVTITMGNSATAANGWSCWVNDLSTPADKLSQTSASTTTTAVFTGTVVIGDTINFGCIGY